jgi:hypothetical protein
MKPFGLTYALEYIEDPNGNRIDLYYDKKDPRIEALSGLVKSNVESALDDDPTTLNAITDPSGRMLILTYYDKLIFQDKRIKEITGFDANTGGSLLGLKIEYTYDDKANLIGVTRHGQLSSDTRTEVSLAKASSIASS